MLSDTSDSTVLSGCDLRSFLNGIDGLLNGQFGRFITDVLLLDLKTDPILRLSFVLRASPGCRIPSHFEFFIETILIGLFIVFNVKNHGQDKHINKKPKWQQADIPPFKLGHL